MLMTDERKRKLERNFFKIFFINSLLNVKMINIVISLFFVYRSLQVAEIFYLAIIYSVAVVISEIPSSYLADRFGRRRTIIMATFFALLHWLVFLVADGFLFFAVGTVCYALAESFMSGTDEAVIYDTNKELGNRNDSLKNLSRYISSERVFKIISAFVGALIAKDLADWQFNIIIMVDIIASFIAFVFAVTLTEPNHFMDLEKQEAGLIKDAYAILSQDKTLRTAVFNKALIFTAAILCWKYSGILFIDHLGISVVVIGATWSIRHLATVLSNHYLHVWRPEKSEAVKIDFLNLLFFIALGLFIFNWFLYPQKYLLLFLYVVSQFFASSIQPLFSNMFNRQFMSYNRATSLSLANFAQHICIIPLAALVGFFINFNLVFPYMISFVVVGAVIAYLSLGKFLYEPKTV